jgi:hypothetical protein
MAEDLESYLRLLQWGALASLALLVLVIVLAVRISRRLDAIDRDLYRIRGKLHRMRRDAPEEED